MYLIICIFVGDYCRNKLNVMSKKYNKYENDMDDFVCCAL